VEFPRRLLGLLVCALSLCLGACHKPPPPRIKVAVTIFPIYDLARRIAGPDADVVFLVPVGAPEVDHQPSDRDAALVAGAKVGILVGLGLDEWMQDVLDQAAPKARRLVVGDRVPTLVYRKNPIAAIMTHLGRPDEDPHLDGKPDPHVWLDPARASLIGKAIAEELAKADPSRAAGYRQRSGELETAMEKLDREVEWRVQNWTSKTFVSFRPAFAYFASRYHLDIAGTLEAYPGVVPAMRYDQEMVKIIRAKGIAGVFREPQFSSAPASIVSLSANVPVGVLDAIGGSEATNTYEKLILFNTDALEKVLKAPAQPRPLDDAGAEDAHPDG
jgi:zinc transport system substrate-binding protein